MVSDLQDTVLQTRVDGGDLTALEVKYQLSYITELRNRHRSFLRQSQGSNSDGNEGKIGARAFVELIPNNWADFLHDSGNKRQLFSFLSNKLEVLECIESKQIFTSGTTSVTAAGASHARM